MIQCNLYNKRVYLRIHLLAHTQHGRFTVERVPSAEAPALPSILVRLENPYGTCNRLNPQVNVSIFDDAPLPPGANLRVWNPPNWIQDHRRESSRFIEELGIQGFFNADTAYKRIPSLKQVGSRKLERHVNFLNISLCLLWLFW